jgi:hypothetical protein
VAWFGNVIYWSAYGGGVRRFDGWFRNVVAESEGWVRKCGVWIRGSCGWV